MPDAGGHEGHQQGPARRRRRGSRTRRLGVVARPLRSMVALGPRRLGQSRSQLGAMLRRSCSPEARLASRRPPLFRPLRRAPPASGPTRGPGAYTDKFSLQTQTNAQQWYIEDSAEVVAGRSSSRASKLWLRVVAFDVGGVHTDAARPLKGGRLPSPSSRPSPSSHAGGKAAEFCPTPGTPLESALRRAMLGGGDSPLGPPELTRPSGHLLSTRTPWAPAPPHHHQGRRSAALR